MKKITFLLIMSAVLSLSCSKDDKDDCDACQNSGEFMNPTTGEVIHQNTDCDRTPPQGFVFVKCMGAPEY